MLKIIAAPFVASALAPVLAMGIVSSAGCSRGHTDAPPSPPAAAAPSAAAMPASSIGAATMMAASGGMGAEIGKPAPPFTLNDLDGHEVRLSDFRGKLVVLEWFNPGCPFVNLSHKKGSLRGAATRHMAEGVMWIAVDSSAPGKQGYEPADIRAAAQRLGIRYPILRDETGAVGRAYGATNTPHMFVIDRSGMLVYGGAIDNSPDAEGEAPQGGPLVNYVDAALSDLGAGRAVQTPRTKAYGCSVKYGS